jgi:molybdate transport system substrate-binding protein
MRLHFLGIFAAIFLSVGSAYSAEIPAIAAASDLKFAIEEIAARFTAESGKKLRLSFGSSGNFARQIEQGAPFELFLSADDSYVRRLVEKGLTRDEGRSYATGRLAIVVPKNSQISLDEKLDGLRGAKINRLAIANPEHAPYGRAAEEILRNLGLWEKLKDHLVLGENVSQAAQFAAGGSTDGGIIAYSLVKAPGMAEKTRHQLISAELHKPLDQRMVLMKNAEMNAQLFFDYLQGPAAREILASYGFR